ncbi:hypothetical protein [Nonomuraea longicatena]|uniref:Uncharacterized protein n=1 Tax=Nonomuraea longicatena TaxID=83682 RepID=A0ABP4BB35_9ACTN
MNEIQALIDIARPLAPHLPLDGITLRAGAVEIVIRPAPGAVPGPLPGRSGNGPAIGALIARARLLISEGELPANAGAGKIRQHLRCGMDTARAVRDALGELA